MQDWFGEISKGSGLSADAVRELHEAGFVIISGPVPPEDLIQLAAAYDFAVAEASADDVSIGSTTTRVHDFVNRGSRFDELYVFQPVLEACCRVIGQPFKLSSMLARTLRPHAEAQALHIDFKSDENGYPMLGFIFMVDEFRRDNGATRFVPGSHKWSKVPDKLINNFSADYENQSVACGAAGSMIIYNGSVWHGHSTNISEMPRRSIQGAFIRRGSESGFDFSARMCPETLARISSLAKYLLGV